jgi:hypothetical protein
MLITIAYDKYLEPLIGINNSTIPFVLISSSGCFFGVFVIINTSDVPGARILDMCTDHRWWTFSCKFFYHDVDLVDLLSINEVYESIGFDMPDHNRCRSHTHLFCRVPMNTRRHTREVWGRAKPSMMIPTEL